MKPRMFFIALGTVAALAACDAGSSPTRPDVAKSGLQSLSAAASGVGKNAICHYDKELDAYLRIDVSANSLPAHFAHGDALAGTSIFDENCQLLECRNHLNINCPPSEDPQSFVDGLEVQLNGGWANLDPPCPGVRQVSWDWGDGTVVQHYGDPPGPFPSQHTYSAGGNYTVVVTLYDATPLALDQATCDLTLGE